MKRVRGFQTGRHRQTVSASVIESNFKQLQDFSTQIVHNSEKIISIVYGIIKECYESVIFKPHLLPYSFTFLLASHYINSFHMGL